MEHAYKYMKCTRPEQKDYHKGGQMIPCGYCPACKYNERVGWTFRLSEESKESKTAWFITLTYNQESVPLWDAAYGYMVRGMDNNASNRCESLNDHDAITFLNSVKKAQNRAIKEVLKQAKAPAEALAERRPKYYLVGEYGGRYGRPHYHIILFNVWQSVANETRLEEIWQKGTVDVQPISPANIHYVTGYVHEKNHYMRERQKRPRMYCSNGIGEDYVKKNKKWHKDLLNPWVWFNGYKIALPKYYKDKIFTSAELEKVNQKLQEHYDLNPKEPPSNHYGDRRQSEYSINSRTKKHKKL